MYQPNDVYWGSKDNSQVIFPFIPYFSNCKGFGQHIFFQALESEGVCDLVPPENTHPIDPFKFGDKSVADNCNLDIPCILDEIPGSKLNDFTRWFEVK